MQVLRSSPLCVLCKAKARTTMAREVDQIVPLFKGGSNELSNLQALCSRCHEDKTARDKGHRVKHTTGLDGWPMG